MRLLFLDIDGVLNGHEKLATGYCGICQQRAGRLNRVLDAVPDAQLVISSAWRYLMLRGDMTLKGFEMLLLVHGIKAFKRLHGHTVADGAICDEPAHDDYEAWRVVGLKMRAEQIRRYVAQHQPVRWVALDDLPLIGVENFIQTCGIAGLTDTDADRAIALLSEQPKP